MDLEAELAIPLLTDKGSDFGERITNAHLQY